ncbi:restriction endonuclease [Burkholderia cepacia]|uniref:restriction endonuclease n=1 Tax=Burkholderia cepacia TaxID=292 RepID=UPI0009C14B27|nr:restriction endonuclease [Burkholderia cepacia]MCA8323128.1 restriction endonuclease [Burkholderia cepacia]RQT74350.1 restriction endonuclease [Burkholderia cepacia]RQT80977.1 restriction endonuclease [Burkholderia cepacia]RQT99716.1 restriction endonuclease [Burkholderia cepacia]RQZ81619.1 restriction endonuclease [Burkholderia cepacia]
MLDFKELAQDGQDFELLIREILFREGFHVAWSGRGADGGRDLVCTENRQTILGAETKKWLVQCKHFAHSERSVGVADLDDIITSAAQHKCSGYLLACSTFPSSGVVQRLEGIVANPEMRLSTNYWDAVQIERLLATPRMWRIAQRFFPTTATGFEIYATESPNRWIVNYRGYYFYLSNRVGSRADVHLESIAARVAEIEAIDLPGDHHLRIRAVYYDDKHGGYTWYLDYLRPYRNLVPVSIASLKRRLKDGWGFEDGQTYHFDIVVRSTSPSSDHYDVDHYDYYEDDAHAFSWGIDRRPSDIEFTLSATEQDAIAAKALQEDSFNAMLEAFSHLSFLNIIRAENCSVEAIRDFGTKWDWKELIDAGASTDRFFSVWIFFRVTDPAKFNEFMTTLPQDFEPTFRLTQPVIYLPAADGEGSELSSDNDEHAYELTLRVGPLGAPDMFTTRDRLNAYMDRIAAAARKFAA